MTRGERLAFVVLGALLALVLVAVAHLTAETPRFIEWCAEQGGVMPYGWYSDPMCVRDGLVLIPPSDSNARWPE